MIGDDVATAVTVLDAPNFADGVMVTTMNNVIRGDMVFNNPKTGEPMLRIAADGFYVRGKKLEQPETEAREVYEVMSDWCRSVDLARWNR